jgi:AraC family transcriptional regulator, positive regulator of tynA and feaB
MCSGGALLEPRTRSGDGIGLERRLCDPDTAEKTMGHGILDNSQLDYEAWRNRLRAMSGRYNPEGIEPAAFTGWVRPVSACGFTALDVGTNAGRIERTYRDVRLDGVDHYFVVFQVRGESALIHNDRAARLAVGDVALVDAARPSSYFAENDGQPWNTMNLILPREMLVSHLGFEPSGGICRRGGTTAGRLLLDLIRNADHADGSSASPADSYMQLAIYDLVGALFAPSDPWPVSRPADKLFTRIRGIIHDGFADPDFGPCAIAAKAGISLRYLQKIFTERGLTASEFIYSLRLDHAARLLHRRASLGTGQPISEIAYASGFRDYTHFARRFRRRFGYSPGAGVAGDGPVRAVLRNGTSLAHDTLEPCDLGHGIARRPNG